MKSYENSRARRYLEQLPVTSLDGEEDTLSARCKFNFSYFDIQEASQSFEDWNHDQLVKLLNKLKEYSKESLQHWKNTSLGKSGAVLSIYGLFPKKTDFVVPKHVPHQAEWGRFRLEQAVRLVGFVLPNEYQGKVHMRTGQPFCCNTFYVVYLDKKHLFYKTEKP